MFKFLIYLALLITLFINWKDVSPYIWYGLKKVDTTIINIQDSYEDTKQSVKDIKDKVLGKPLEDRDTP